MTSKTKIGLLLGLVFIFVIAYTINGPSGVDDMSNGDYLSSSVVIDPPGIIPNIPPDVLPPDQVSEWKPNEIPIITNKDLIPDQLKDATWPAENNNYIEDVMQAWPKVHIVRKGDSLADIAKKYYGPKEGNRRANIRKIFEANSKLLKSPDKIYPGQKLIIPPL